MPCFPTLNMHILSQVYLIVVIFIIVLSFVNKINVRVNLIKPQYVVVAYSPSKSMSLFVRSFVGKYILGSLNGKIITNGRYMKREDVIYNVHYLKCRNRFQYKIHFWQS